MQKQNYLQVYKNSKTKCYSNGYTNTIACKNHIFKSDWDISPEQNAREIAKHETAEQHTQNILDYLEARGLMDVQEWHEVKRERERNAPKKESFATSQPVRSDSVKRAKDSIFDYVLNNDFEYFFTGTINPEELDSKNPKELLKPLQKWLQNMVQRYNMQYIMIAEYHKKSGGIHFHGLFKADNLRLVYSGTRLYKGYNKPVSDERAEKLGLSEGREVYNLATWRFGFSTCIKLVGERMNTAFYITKYITKDCKKIFGKFFWHNRSLPKPQLRFEDVDFESLEAVERNGFKYIFKTGDENNERA